MSEYWNQEYQDEVSRLDFFFQQLYPTWASIGEIDFTKRRPRSLFELRDAADELIEALSDFIVEVDVIKNKFEWEKTNEQIVAGLYDLIREIAAWIESVSSFELWSRDGKYSKSRLEAMELSGRALQLCESLIDK